MKHHLVIAASLCAAVAGSGVAQATTVNPHPMTLHSVQIKLPRSLVHRKFAPGKGADLANGYCRICHSADFVYVQPPLSKKNWKVEVVKMQKAFKCPLPDKDVNELVTYLYSQNGKK